MLFFSLRKGETAHGRGGDLVLFLSMCAVKVRDKVKSELGGLVEWLKLSNTCLASMKP
jgi:hypothetical protein